MAIRDLGGRPDPGSPVPGRVPSLDGLRAVSIALVLFCHAAPSLRGSLPHFWRKVAREAEIGVDVFFAISGLLITLLMLRESDRAGRVSLSGFYARRALRILPAFGTYLAFVAALVGLGLATTSPTDWIAATTYTVNAVGLMGRDPAWVFGHLWSLSVEEQFYLIWPVALARLGPGRAPAALAATIAITPTSRLLMRAAFPGAVGFGILKFSTVTRIDSIAVGCLLGLLIHDPGLRRASGRARSVARAAAMVGVATAAAYSAAGLFDVAIKPTVKALALGAVVAACIRRPRSLVGRFLNARPVARVGVLSYSLYLWQQPFFDPKGGPAICRWPTNLILAVACAVGSHYLIERPFLRLKGRLGRRAEPGPRPHSRSTSQDAATVTTAGRA